MDYPEALKRLANHANGPQPMSLDSESLSFVLWKADREDHIPNLRGLYDDILACFEAVNREINTECPSQVSADKADALPRSLMSHVAELLRVGWSFYWEWTLTTKFTPEFRKGFGAMLVRLSSAWSYVLDGDIDTVATEAERDFEIRYQALRRR